jgi:hypothetical protein
MLKLPPTYCAKANMGAQEATAVSSAVSIKALADKIRNVGDDILDIMEKAYGHALREHVAKTNNKLTRRSFKFQNAASSFTNKRIAIRAVKQNLRHNANEIAAWLKNPNTDLKKVLDYHHEYTIGKGVIRSKKITYGFKNSKIVLKIDPTNELGFRILTAYPFL